MRLSLILIIMLLATSTFAGAQQEPLDAEQQAMLDTVRAALEQQRGWEHYRQFTVTTSRTAWTVTGGDMAVWETRNITAQIDAEVEPGLGLVSGDLQWQTEVASSEESRPTSETQSITFSAVEGQVFVQRAGQTRSIDVSDDLADYQQTGLSALVTYPPLDNTVGLLDHTLSIEDMGISRINRRDQHTYRLTLDFPESLPHLDFNIDEFISHFNGVVELAAFTENVMADATLTFDVTLDVRSGSVIATTLVLQIPIEMQEANVVRVASGDGEFQLEYARQVDTEYTLLDE